MNPRHHVAADQAPAAQLALELEVRLDLPTAVQELAPGERFLLESCGIEGRVIACGPSGAVVSIRGADDDHWTQTRWSLQTEVRRLRA
jgi:hypothetical protein